MLNLQKNRPIDDRRGEASRGKESWEKSSLVDFHLGGQLDLRWRGLCSLQAVIVLLVGVVCFLQDSAEEFEWLDLQFFLKNLRWRGGKDAREDSRHLDGCPEVSTSSSPCRGKRAKEDGFLFLSDLKEFVPRKHLASSSSSSPPLSVLCQASDRKSSTEASFSLSVLPREVLLLPPPHLPSFPADLPSYCSSSFSSSRLASFFSGKKISGARFSSYSPAPCNGEDTHEGLCPLWREREGVGGRRCLCGACLEFRSWVCRFLSDFYQYGSYGCGASSSSAWSRGLARREDVDGRERERTGTTKTNLVGEEERRGGGRKRKLSLDLWGKEKERDLIGVHGDGADGRSGGESEREEESEGGGEERRRRDGHEEEMLLLSLLSLGEVGEEELFPPTEQDKKFDVVFVDLGAEEGRRQRSPKFLRGHEYSLSAAGGSYSESRQLVDRFLNVAREREEGRESAFPPCPQVASKGRLDAGCSSTKKKKMKTVEEKGQEEAEERRVQSVPCREEEEVFTLISSLTPILSSILRKKHKEALRELEGAPSCRLSAVSRSSFLHREGPLSSFRKALRPPFSREKRLPPGRCLRRCLSDGEGGDGSSNFEPLRSSSSSFSSLVTSSLPSARPLQLQPLPRQRLLSAACRATELEREAVLLQQEPQRSRPVHTASAPASSPTTRLSRRRLLKNWVAWLGETRSERRERDTGRGKEEEEEVASEEEEAEVTLAMSPPPLGIFLSYDEQLESEEDGEDRPLSSSSSLPIPDAKKERDHPTFSRQKSSPYAGLAASILTSRLCNRYNTLLMHRQSPRSYLSPGRRDASVDISSSFQELKDEEEAVREVSGKKRKLFVSCCAREQRTTTKKTSSSSLLEKENQHQREEDGKEKEEEVNREDDRRGGEGEEESEKTVCCSEERKTEKEPDVNRSVGTERKRSVSIVVSSPSPDCAEGEETEGARRKEDGGADTEESAEKDKKEEAEAKERKEEKRREEEDEGKESSRRGGFQLIRRNWLELAEAIAYMWIG